MPSGLFTRRQHLQAVITNSWAGRPSSVDYLVVAGGGGSTYIGGAGAGGLLQGRSTDHDRHRGSGRGDQPAILLFGGQLRSALEPAAD